MIQLEGDGTTPASTGRFEAPPGKARTESPEKIFVGANLFTGLRRMIFLGGIIIQISTIKAVITPLRAIAKRCKHLKPLLVAPAALLLSQGQAKAILTYFIFESAGNVVIETSGSLNLTAPTGTTPSCPPHGVVIPSIAFICTGPFAPVFAYPITGPTSFNGTGSVLANSSTGIATTLFGVDSIGLSPAYVSGTPIYSSSTFNGQTLASLGFTATGLIGTWTLVGTTQTIQVVIIPPPPSGAAVPGPLPLLGAGAAFGWSRRLRRRIAAPLSTPPQA